MSNEPDTVSQNATRGTLLLLAAAAMWSTNGLIIKQLHDAEGIGGASIAAYRSVVAAAFLAPFAFRRRRPIAEGRWVAGAVLLFTGMTATFVLATTLTTAANAIILQYTAPAWVFLLSPWIVGERAQPRQWLAFAMSMVAVAFIFAVQYQSDRVGLIVGLASGVVFGAQIVFFRRVRAMDPVVLACLCAAGSGIALVPVALACDGWQIAASSALLLLVAGVVQFGFPYVLYAAGNRHVSAQSAVLIIMLEPVLNPIWVYLVRGEAPHWSTIAGGGLILASVCYLSITKGEKKVSG